jgi:hypothetical protein
LAALEKASSEVRPALGVLFVHGIGEQDQGQTLISWSDAIADWFAGWFRRDPAALAAIGPLDGESPVSLQRSDLQPESAGTPGNVAVVIGRRSESGDQRSGWLLAESWWADVVQPPKGRTLLLWLLVILPYQLLAQFWVPVWRGLRRLRESDSKLIMGLRALGVAADVLIYLLAAAPLAGIGSVVLVLLLVPLALPVSRLRTIARSVTGELANTVGDAFILTSSATQYDAMVRRVSRDLNWLSRRVPTVAVVSHSQGAALAYEAIRNYGRPRNLGLLVTVGEGIGKLLALRALRERGYGVLVLAWIGLAGFFVFAVFAPQFLLSFRAEAVNRTLVVALASGGLVLWLGPTCWALKTALSVERPPGLDPRMRWINYYASADPVSNGPLAGTCRGNEREIEVWNRASVLSDHSTYLKSADDFVSCLVRTLSSASGQDPASLDQSRDQFERARWLGWWRVWWLASARLLCFGAAIAVVWQVWDQLGTIGHGTGVFGDVVFKATAPLRTALVGLHPRRDRVAGAVLLMAVLLASYLLVSLVWRYWELREVRRFFNPESNRASFRGTEFGWFIGALGIAVAAGVIVAWEADFRGAWHFLRDHPLAASLILACVAFVPPAARLSYERVTRFHSFIDAVERRLRSVVGPKDTRLSERPNPREAAVISLVEQWCGIDRDLGPTWGDAGLSLTLDDEEQYDRASTLLGPASPGRSGETIRFTVARRGAGVGPEAIRRLLERLDAEGIRGTLELASSSEGRTEAATGRGTLAESWDAAVAVLPGDWTDLYCELELRSTDYLDRAALLTAPLNPVRSGVQPTFRFRCARRYGYGATSQMVRRCLERLDEEKIQGSARVLQTLSDTHPVQTQGPVWRVGGKTA